MDPNLNQLQPYPFQKLAELKAGVTPPDHLAPIMLSIGEPKGQPSQRVRDAYQNHLDKLGQYPSTLGLPALRQAIADWACHRFQLQQNSLTADHHILPVNGTREALFAFTQVVIDRSKNPLVLMPNPFYQIYEGAALLAGAHPWFLNCDESNGFLPDFDQVTPQVWEQCQLLFLCSPGNPTGAVIDRETLKRLIQLADQYDFILASDECYSEIYTDEKNPPVGLLQACAELGRHDYQRCVVFHSLSKRSNLPGMRSGFVAGDAAIIEKFLLYRTYHGCAMPVQTQLASITAWEDEAFVVENRRQYAQKFSAVVNILQEKLNVTLPDAGFYLWIPTPVSDTEFARKLYAQQHITVLPGSFLARNTPQGNPGENRVRLALVASMQECINAAERIATFLDTI